jgi:hypothetical protein
MVRMAWLTLLRMTCADTVRQPVTWLMTLVSLVLVFLSYAFGLFNFLAQDRLHMLATAGVAVSTINGLFLAVVLASQSVHDELSSRTALTLFAKPVGRGDFLVGKMLGVWATVGISSLIVAAVHVALLAWAIHTGFGDGIDDDAHAASDDALHLPWPAILAAHALGLGHSAVLASISAVLALRLPLVANILVSFGIFLVGNLLPACGIMGFLAIPALTVFNIDDCIQLALPISAGYLAMTALYTACICAGWLSIGLAVFERQDIP